MRHAGIKPHIQCIGHFVVLIYVFAQQFGIIKIIPSLYTLFFYSLSHLLHKGCCIRVNFTGFFVQINCYRHTPIALTRHTPIWAVLDHSLNSRLSPIRFPVNRINCLKSLIAKPLVTFKVLHTNKPLCGSTIDHRRFMSPTMWVAVFIFLML